MIAYTEGRGRVRHVWALVCQHWGIHVIAQTRREARTVDTHKLPGSCGPHRLVKWSVRS
jgi:hypothetical protein